MGREGKERVPVAKSRKLEELMATLIQIRADPTSEALAVFHTDTMRVLHSFIKSRSLVSQQNVILTVQSVII
jgi:hypothetical protein